MADQYVQRGGYYRFIRHARPEYFRGALRRPTAAEGSLQSYALEGDPGIVPGQKIVPLGFVPDIVVTSPYRRCMETADLYLATLPNSVQYVVDPKVAEWDGSPAALRPDAPISVPPQETWDEFAARVGSFIGDLLKQDRNVLVVTHGIVVNYAHQVLFDGERFRPRARDVPYMDGWTIEGHVPLGSKS